MTQTGDDVRGRRVRALTRLVATLIATFPAFAAAAPVGLPANPPTDVPTDPTVAALVQTEDEAEPDADDAEGEPLDDAAAEAAERGDTDAHALLERAEALAGGVPVPETLQQQLEPREEEPCLSVGEASWGRLINGVQLPEFPSVRVRAASNFGTPETVASIIYAVQKVRATHPDTPPLVIGDLSRERGGRFRPHKSHQAGRDADIGYYIVGQKPGVFADATPDNLDVPRTWTFIEALMEDDKVEYLFIDRRLHRPLYDYARDVAQVDEDRLRDIFAMARARTGIIRHVRGHRNHMHVRFRSPIAVAAARDPANQEMIAKAPKGPELMTVRVTYKVKKGDTLGHIAKKHRVSVKDLMRWNGIKKANRLKPGQTIRILREREVRPTKKAARSAGT